jgi:transposase
MGNYAGVERAADKHDVRVCDEAGEELVAATFAHDEKGLRALCRSLVRLKLALVAIERPDGLLVERLLDAGLRVLAMHPNQVAAARARIRVSGGKSDRFDAFVCASSRAQIIIASGCSSPTATRPRRCGFGAGPAFVLTQVP